MINSLVKEAFVNATDSRIAISEYVRNETLNRAYAVDGYASLPEAEKMPIYDAKRAEVIGELEGMGISF